MAVINNAVPAQTTSSNSAAYIVGIILLLAVIFALFYYGLPLLGNGGTGGSSVGTPGSMNINVNPGAGAK